MRFPAILLLTTAAASLTGLTPAARADTTRVSDVCVGAGTAGPYSLSWTKLLPGTETVEINGIPQMRGLDYTVDADKGTVTFTRSLPAQSVASVAYLHEDGAGQRNVVTRTLPLSLDVLRGDKGYFSLSALGKQSGSDGNVTLGIGAGLNGGGSNQLSSRLMFSPVTAAGDTASADKRLGLALSGSANASNWGQFSFGVSRVGSGVQDTGSAEATVGLQRLNLRGLLTPTRRLKAEVRFDQSRLADNSDAPTTTNTALSLTMTPTDRTNLAASLAQTATGDNGQTQTIGLSVDTRPADTLKISAAFSGKDAPGGASDTQAVSVRSVLTPAKTLSLETAAGQTRTAANLTDNQSVKVTLNPFAAVQLNAGLTLQQTAAVGTDANPLATSIASVGGTLRPVSFLELSGTYKSRSASAADTNVNDLFDTSTAKIAFKPVSGFSVVGTYALNPDGGGTTIQRQARRGLGLETHLGALGLSGGCDWTQGYDTPADTQTVRANLGLRFSAATQLLVGYQSTQDLLQAAATPATAYTVGFTHSLGDRLSLSVNGKRIQDASAANADYNASANLGIKF